MPSNFLGIYVNPIPIRNGPLTTLIILSVSKLGLPKIATMLIICFLI